MKAKGTFSLAHGTSCCPSSFAWNWNQIRNGCWIPLKYVDSGFLTMDDVFHALDSGFQNLKFCWISDSFTSGEWSIQQWNSYRIQRPSQLGPSALSYSATWLCVVYVTYTTPEAKREILGTRLIPHTTHYSSDEKLLLDTSLFVRVTTASLLKCLAELGVRSYTRWCLLSGLSPLVYNKGLSGVVNNDYDTLRVMYFKYRSRFALLVSAECSLKKWPSNRCKNIKKWWVTSALLALANIDHIFPQHASWCQIFQLLINPSRLLLCAISVVLVWQTFLN